MSDFQVNDKVRVKYQNSAFNAIVMDVFGDTLTVKIQTPLDPKEDAWWIGQTITAHDNNVIMGWAEPNPPTPILDQVLKQYQQDPIRQKRDAILAHIFGTPLTPITYNKHAYIDSLLGKYITFELHEPHPVLTHSEYKIIEYEVQFSNEDEFVYRVLIRPAYKLEDIHVWLPMNFKADGQPQYPFPNWTNTVVPGFYVIS